MLISTQVEHVVEVEVEPGNKHCMNIFTFLSADRGGIINPFRPRVPGI